MHARMVKNKKSGQICFGASYPTSHRRTLTSIADQIFQRQRVKPRQITSAATDAGDLGVPTADQWMLPRTDLATSIYEIWVFTIVDRAQTLHIYR